MQDHSQTADQLLEIVGALQHRAALDYRDEHRTLLAEAACTTRGLVGWHRCPIADALKHERLLANVDALAELCHVLAAEETTPREAVHWKQAESLFRDLAVYHQQRLNDLVLIERRRGIQLQFPAVA